MFNTHDLMTQI